MSKLAKYNKTIVVVLGLILLVGSDVANNLNDLLPASWITTLNVALGLLTAFLAFWVRNEQVVVDIAHDVQSPSLPGGIDAVSKMTELAADIRAEVVKARMHPVYVPSPSPRSAGTVSAGTVTVDVVPRVDTAAFQAAAAAVQEVPVPDPAPVPQPEPSAPTGTYPDGPYVPPKPAYTGPNPPVSEPVGATAVSATP